jgi:hypothetical protein
MLIYPFEDVKEYIALNWAKECVSEQWLKFDKMVREQKRLLDEKRRKGINAPDIEPKKIYITQVEQLNKNKDSFAVSIVRDCTVFDSDGATIDSETWTKYADALIQKIEIDESSGNSTLEAKKGEIRGAISGLEGGKDSYQNFVNVYYALESYKNMVMKDSEETAHSIAFTIFKASPESITSAREKFRLET